MADRLWFSQAMEGLFIRGVGDRMTPGLREGLQKLGIDLAALVPAYKVEAVVSAIRLTSSTLFSDKPEPEALRAVGALFMDGYAQTLLGRAMVQFMKVIGPRRSLERMQRNFRTGGNYIETRFTSLDSHKAEVWFNDVGGIPDFYAGIITRGGQFAGASELSVRFEPSPDASCAFVVEWTD